MQRKYSEVVNYIPSFPNMELRNNNRELPTNPKLSPLNHIAPIIVLLSMLIRNFSLF